MKKTLLVLAMVLLVACFSVFAFAACNNTDNNTITMYTEAGFAPYEWMSSNGKITGVDVAIMSQVAENLGISEKTVQVHRGSAYRKLDLHNAAEIARLLLRSGDPL